MRKVLEDGTHMTPSPHEWGSALRSVWQSRREVLFAYLFGSFVQGRTNPESDIDIAIYLQDGTDATEFVFSVMPHLVQCTRCDRIDLVVLNTAPLSLGYIVQKDGVLIFERSEKERIDFEVRTRMLFWDYVPLMKTYSAYLLERLKEGTFGT